MNNEQELRIHTCAVCGNSEANQTYTVREMQYGTRDEFEYFECSKCGCLQIVDFPSDISKYYPTSYYSYAVRRPSLEYPQAPIPALRVKLLNEILSRHYFGKRSALGSWVAQRSSLVGDYPLWVRRKNLDLGLRPNSPILDVGAGAGKLLLDLNVLGFRNLTGVDPFIEKDICYPNGVKVLKKELKEMNQEFDLVMFNHSFEHMPDPLATLGKAYELVKPGHFLIIRIPLAGSYAWRKYGVNWVGLDAPRHFYLHTPKSMQLLASAVGFDLAEIVFDSDGLGHWGSELYKREIALTDERSYWVNSKQNIFTAKEIAEFIELDEELNRTGEADCAAFCLYKT